VVKYETIEGTEYQIGSDGTVIGLRGKPLALVKGHGIRHTTVQIRTTEGKRKEFVVNKLVMSAFGTEQPSPKHRILHRDDNFNNCAIDNLCWVIFKKGMGQLLTEQAAEVEEDNEPKQQRFEEPNSIYEYF